MSRAKHNGLEDAIADLAAMHADDAQEVMAALTLAERRRVGNLLEGFMSSFDRTLQARELGYDSSQISNWLDQILSESSSNATLLSPLARETLRQCAISLYPSGPKDE